MGNASRSWKEISYVATVGSFVAAILAIVVSVVSYQASKDAADAVDRETKKSIVSKVSWSYEKDGNGKILEMTVSNHSLTPVYDVQVRVTSSNEVVENFFLGNLPACEQISLTLNGADGRMSTENSYLSLVDFRSQTWHLNTEGDLETAEKYSPPNLVDQAKALGISYDKKGIDNCG